VIALLFAAYLAYLYTPHLLFKFAAGTRYEFVIRKEVPQVEEFFAAGLPSAILNGFALGLLWVLPKVPLIDRVPILSDVRRVWPDRKVVSSIFTEKPDLKAYFETGDLDALGAYIAALLLTAWFAGWFYGYALRAIARAGGPKPFLDKAYRFRGMPIGLVWAIPAVLYRNWWYPFYKHYEQPLYPNILRNAFAFVHTKGGGLFHGILYNADRARDSDIEGIYLIGVSRFSRKSEKDCIATGENPIRPMDGPLFIKWAEIDDINFPHDQRTLENKIKEYDRKIEEHRAARNPTWVVAFEGLVRKLRRWMAR
jgi:hypothetical protein